MREPRRIGDAGAVDREELAQELQRIDDGDAHFLVNLLQEALHLPQQHRLSARQRPAPSSPSRRSLELADRGQLAEARDKSRAGG